MSRQPNTTERTGASGIFSRSLTSTQLLGHGSSSFTPIGSTAGKYASLRRVADTPAHYAVVAYCRIGTNLQRSPAPDVRVMPKKRYMAEEIIQHLRTVERENGKGLAVFDACQSVTC